jgi:predicted GNAT superfamily acetyltransferase
MGLDAVAWAFDPLQASNAAFNLGVLGATCRLYELDMYGSRSDALNAGMATDRLIAEWSTSGEHIGRTAPWPEALDLIETADCQPSAVAAIPSTACHVQIEVPPRIADLKVRGAPNAAPDWQSALRQAFQSAFAMGFIAIGFARTDPSRPRYLLERAL